MVFVTICIYLIYIFKTTISNILSNIIIFYFRFNNISKEKNYSFINNNYRNNCRYKYY